MNDLDFMSFLCCYDDTHLPPLVEQPTCRPLQQYVSTVTGRLAAAVQEAGLSEPGEVHFHPLGPVAVVTAVHKVRTFEQQRSPGDNWSFLKEKEEKILLKSC